MKKILNINETSLLYTRTQRRTAVEYVLRDVATLLAVPYYKIYYAHYSGLVPEPRKVGKTRIYTEADLESLRKYFAQRKGKIDNTRQLNNQ
jgi:hypothetical protein